MATQNFGIWVTALTCSLILYIPYHPHLFIWVVMDVRSKAEWPDLCEISPLWQNLEVFGNFSGINLVFGNICNLFWQFLYAIELIFINGNGQILKNTLDIWLHWSKALMLINTFRNSHNLKTPNGQEKVIFIESALLLPFQNFFGLIFILECNYMSCPVWPPLS